MKIKLPNKNILFYFSLLAAVLLCCALQIIALTGTKAVLKSIGGDDVPVLAAATSPISEDALFLLRECGGKIGIFDAKSNILVDVIDVFAASLPAADRKALQEGVEIRSFTELAAVIEDLST